MTAAAEAVRRHMEGEEEDADSPPGREAASDQEAASLALRTAMRRRLRDEILAGNSPTDLVATIRETEAQEQELKSERNPMRGDNPKDRCEEFEMEIGVLSNTTESNNGVGQGVLRVFEACDLSDIDLTGWPGLRNAVHNGQQMMSNVGHNMEEQMEDFAESDLLRFRRSESLYAFVNNPPPESETMLRIRWRLAW